MLTILKEFLPHKGKLILAFVLGALMSLGKSSIPKLFEFLTEAWTSGDEQMTLLLPLALSSIWLCVSVLRFFHLYIMRMISEVITLNFRKKLMNKYLRLDLSYIQNFNRGSGGLMSRMLNDISIIQNDLMKMAHVIREPLLIILVFAYLLYVDWKLVAIILLSAPIISWVLKSLAKKLRHYGSHNQEKMEDLTKTLKEGLDGARIIQSFNLENEMNQKFDKQADDYLGLRRKIIKFEEASGPVSEAITTFALAAILVYIGQQILDKQLNIGQFLSFSVALTLLSESIRKLQQAYIKLQQVSVAIKRMNDVLVSEQMVPQIASPKKFPTDWQDITFKNVNFSYEDNQVLNNVNLSVKRGETVALVGSSGGGKSTLINLLPRFYDVQSGDIQIGGTPINHMDLFDLRSKIALVSQDIFLFSDTIKQNLLYGSKVESNIEQAAQLAHAHDFITKTPNGYDTQVGDIGNKLSGGQKQRLSIARAFVKNAPILILDEATSALDYESELEVQKGLQKLMEGRTTFIIAHRLSTIINADKIVVLNKGQVVEQGTHDELLALGNEYAKLYKMQN